MHGPQRHPSTPFEAIASRIGLTSASRPIVASRHRTRPCHGPDPTRRYSQNSKGCRAANLALARAHPVRPGTRTTHGSPVLLGAKAQVKHTSASCEHPSYLYLRTYVLRTWSCARSPRYNDGDGPNGGVQGTEATTHLGSPLDWIARPWPRRFLRRWGASSSSRQKRTGAVGRGPQGGRIPAPSPQSPLCTPARSPALGRQTQCQCRERVQETPLTPWP